LPDADPNAADPWLTLAEIADELRVNPATVRLWVSKGQLKASRAGVRKWIVRRSDLDRMLAETNVSAGDGLDRSPSGESAELGPPVPRRPDPGAEPGDESPEPRKPRTSSKDPSAVELLRLASEAYDRATIASAQAPPSPGYVDRIRAVADACEHVAATMLNAVKKAGIRWRPRTDIADKLPYELKHGGNRPGPEEMWEDFDAAFERLAITATGTDVTALALAFREVYDALRMVADELADDDEWQVWERQAQ
jgi:excisionase family DNA binding protein